MKRTLAIVITVVSIFALAWHFRYVATAPSCVTPEGLYTVRVESAEMLPLRCDAIEIRSYLQRHDFEYVGSDGFDKIYSR